MKYKNLIIYGIAILLLLSIVDIVIMENFRRITDPYDSDEHRFVQFSNNFSVDYLNYLYLNTLETKPITFLTLQKVLNNADPSYTRSFNFLLIIICTFLIFKITNNRLAILFILIPIILDSMWLTAEIVEIMFILLSIQYMNRSGIFTGLAMIFRPTAILYTLLLNKKQTIYVLIIGTLFALFLLVIGNFFPYLYEVTHYVGTTFIPPDMFVVIIFILLIIIGLNKKMLGYVVISTIPLGMKLYPHYFMPVFTFLFIGFLLNMKKDTKKSVL